MERLIHVVGLCQTACGKFWPVRMIWSGFSGNCQSWQQPTNPSLAGKWPLSLCLCLSVSLCVCLSVCLSVFLSVLVYVSVRVSVCV